MTEAAFLVCLAAVAVGAAHMALSNLNGQPLHADVAPYHSSDLKVFADLMIELQDDRVGLAAINTWVSQQVLKQPRLDNFSVLSLLSPGARDHHSTILLVVPL
ncbi:hypothetical protein LJB71_08280 [Thermomonas sp. S9]|uniref:hypothetical protein n=1 Tax=Thermomonas sp. S9 TaxID=2885203 RepID=UPI00216AE847|nr:hypothetical protein [Thermomonas sp. S9]MCR6496212.1 hypothetical protein [Thermomonas sp. S9]